MTEKNASSKKSMGWRLQDVLLMAMLGLLFGLVYLGVFYLGLALQTALTPAGLGPFAFELVYGIWFLGATLAAYIMQKPGVAFVTEVIASLLELLMGNSGGVLVVITGVIQGLGAEAGFALFRYKRWDIVSLLTSGILAAVFTMFQTIYIGGYSALSPGIIFATVIVRIISSVVFAGFAALGLGRGLAKTGVLKSYPLGRQFAPKLDAADDEL